MPPWAQIAIVVLLLAISAFFSISETSMMALNRHRLKHLVRVGNRSARYTLALLQRTDKLLSVILIGNNLINTILSVLITGLAIHYLGASTEVISIATGVVAFLIIVFCEIAPKIIGANYPERIALTLSYILKPLVWLAQPLVWFVNLFVLNLIKMFRIKMDTQQNISLSAEELRTIVLESGKFIPNQHRRILLNLLDLKHITVDDIMTPKARMEVLNMGRSIEAIIEQLETCYHNKLPVFDNDQEAVLGILHIRKTLALLGDPDAFNKETLRTLLTPAYYIPSGTHVLQQLQYFQENHARLGLIVNEYGEVQGLITVEDIIEEMIGKFTTSQPGTDAHVAWDTQGCYVTDAGVSLRELNRQLKINLPLDGPKTLNGLLLESLREIPDASVSIKIANCAMDVLQIDNQVIKTVRIHQPTPQHLTNKRSNQITE